MFVIKINVFGLMNIYFLATKFLGFEFCFQLFIQGGTL
jgi:hypothetical protein